MTSPKYAVGQQLKIVHSNSTGQVTGEVGEVVEVYPSFVGKDWYYGISVNNTVHYIREDWLAPIDRIESVVYHYCKCPWPQPKEVFTGTAGGGAWYKVCDNCKKEIK